MSGLWRGGRGLDKGDGDANPAVYLSGSRRVSEGAQVGIVIGGLSMVGHPSGASGWSFAIVSQAPANKLDISSISLRVAAALNYEANQTLLVTIRGTKSGQANVNTVFSIAVTNEFEAANLAALALDDTNIPEDSAATVNITGATATSTIALLTGVLPTGMLLDSDARTLAGTPTALGTYDFTLRETLADSANSPRETPLSVTVSEAPLPAGLQAPTMELVSDQDAYPPQFDLLLGVDILSTDSIRLQAATDEAFASVVLSQAVTAGTGALTFSALANITSGEHYFRARTEQGADFSTWTDIIKHGDVTAPTITSGNSVSAIEGITNPSGTATADETVTWAVTGGANAGSVTIDAVTGVWTINATTDYDFGLRVYVWQMTATDLAGNVSAPQTFTYTVLNDPLNDPEPQWAGAAGFDRASFLAVSGAPLLTVVNAGTGNPGFIRCRAPTAQTKFQVEFTVDALAGDSYHVIGVDAGADSFAGALFLGSGATTAVVLQYINGYQGTYIDNALVHETFVDVSVGDKIGYRCNVAGSIEFYRMRSGFYTTIWTQIFTSLATTFAIAGVKAFDTTAQLTANFGATAFARTLSDGYTEY